MVLNNRKEQLNNTLKVSLIYNINNHVASRISMVIFDGHFDGDNIFSLLSKSLPN